MSLPSYVKRAIYSGPMPVLRDWRTLPVHELTLGEKVCSFIEQYLVVPEGSLVGKTVNLEPFQQAFIISVYDNPHDTSLAILSIARKNAKTALIAFLLLANLIGPVAVRNSRLNSGAMSRQQASEVYNYAAKSAELSPMIRELVKCVPSTKTIVGLPLNTEYRALSADASTNIGGSPRVAVIDECGQIKGPRSDFVDAITTAQAAHDDPLMLYISTQSATDADFLSIAIDDARKNKPERTVCHVYAADDDCDVLDEKQWQYSNPALGKFRSERDMKEQAEKASRMPSFENTFRNLLLNQRISTMSPFVSRSVWEANASAPEPLEGMPCFAGLDLSARTDLTSFTLVGMSASGAIHVYPYFWTPEVGLYDRAKRDRVPYDLWVQQGFLRTTPGATVDYEYVATEIGDIVSEVNLQGVGFDRWRMDVFKKELERIGLELPMVEVGQGFKDMSPALDELESSLLNSRIRHGANPVLSMCAANAVVTKDAAGNRKLDKHKATGRIDGMVSLAMALAISSKQLDDTAGFDEFLRNPIIV